ncbi:hypothetical protein PI125_g20515, partial [Phytophthora idaei]
MPANVQDVSVETDPDARNTAGEPSTGPERDQAGLGGVPLDDFGADNFLAALRHDEGDEDSILLDEEEPGMESGDAGMSVDDDDEVEGTVEPNGAKRRQWICKVCSAFAGAGVRSFGVSYFCATCSRMKKGKVTLCNKARRLKHGSDLTCNEVWRQTWKNGTAISADLQHKI